MLPSFKIEELEMFPFHVWNLFVTGAYLLIFTKSGEPVNITIFSSPELSITFILVASSIVFMLFTVMYLIFQRIIGEIFEVIPLSSKGFYMYTGFLTFGLVLIDYGITETNAMSIIFGVIVFLYSLLAPIKKLKK